MEDKINCSFFYLPIEATNTTPSPSESGPLILRYFWLGAQAAVALKAPTTPAVYIAALATNGPWMCK